MLECELLTERDKRFAVGFHMDALVEALDAYCSGGRRLVDTLMAQNIAKSVKAEIVMALERATLELRRVSDGPLRRRRSSDAATS